MLKFQKLPSYLSPSALMQAENMPNTFYLNRLTSDDNPRDPQHISAAVGSAFDYWIKERLFKNRFPHKQHLLSGLKKGIETNKVVALRMGALAYRAYLEGAYEEEEYNDVELNLSKTIEGVPLTGKLDSTSKITTLSGYEDTLRSSVCHDDIVIPHDWKTMGFNSKSPTSPKPGYFKLFEGIRRLPSHDDFDPDMPFETIDYKWATQLCTYGWLMDYPVGQPFHVRLDALIWKNGNIRCVARYYGLISMKFQMSVLRRYQRLWLSIMDGSFALLLGSEDDENIIWMNAKIETWF